MKKIILLYGLISSLIISVFMIGSTVIFAKDATMSIASMVVGFTGMFVAFAFIFVALKKLRDQNGGVLTLKDALITAVLIAFIASSTYVLVWMLEYQYVFPDFMEKYNQAMLKDMYERNVPQLEIDKTLAQMMIDSKNYQDPLYRIIETYKEVFPIGLGVALIAAVVMKRKPKELPA